MHRHGTPRGNGFGQLLCEQGEVTFDIRRGGRRRGKETPCAWRVTFLGVPNLHPTLWSTACRLARLLTATTKEKCATTCCLCRL